MLSRVVNKLHCELYISNTRLTCCTSFSLYS